jgi:hypothetical protein
MTKIVGHSLADATETEKCCSRQSVLTCGREMTGFSLNHDTDYRDSGFSSFAHPLQVNVCRVP